MTHIFFIITFALAFVLGRYVVKYRNAIAKAGYFKAKYERKIQELEFYKYEVECLKREKSELEKRSV